jgi:hypothetical protein
VHVVGHRFELDDRHVIVRTDLRDDLFEQLVDLARRNRAPTLRPPQDMGGAV